jgi:hypothetical protein
MKPFALLAGLGLTLAGCAHVESTHGRFAQQADGALVLKLSRHVDTIVSGPDIEEDQTLMLTLRRVEIGKRIEIPSDDVSAEFTAVRFGPSSYGESYRGYILVRSVSDKQVVAALKLEVVAQTETGSYKQTARFNDEYTFGRERAHD